MTENRNNTEKGAQEEKRRNAHPRYSHKKPAQNADKGEKKPTDNKAQKSELRSVIVKTVKEKDGLLKKKDLFDVCLACFTLTAAEKRDRSPESKWTNCRSITGLAIAELVAEGQILIDQEGYCKIPAPEKADSEAALKEGLEILIPDLLKDGKKLTKKEILSQCVAAYPKAKPQSVKCEGGKALSSLKESGKIRQDKQKGVFYLEERFPNTPLGKTFRLAYEGGDVKKCFIDALNLSGGPFFEKFSVELFEKEFATHGTVEKAEVTGGPDDGGIDGKIVYRDDLGFRETVLLQAKLRNVTKSENKYEAGKQITLKEVREFFGAAVAAKGTRYIWVTTTTFCKEAKNFIEKQPDFIGVNKDKLYELAKKHSLGVLTVDGKEELDYKKFS